MSKIFVDQVDPKTGTSLTLGTSGDTVNIPSGVTLANAGTVTGLPASAISSGTIATARLGSGTASSSTFLRGDQTYAAAGGENTPAWLVTMNANQTGISSNASTLVEMDTELLDTDNAYTNTSGNYKFTVPSGKAGTYVIGALLYANTSSVAQFRVQIYKNGSRIARWNVNDSSNPNYPSAIINILDVASVGDYYQCYVYHNSGGNIDLYGNEGTSSIGPHGFFGYKLIT